MVYPYWAEPASFREWDKDAPDAAAYLIGSLIKQLPRLQGEHIGSTAIEGCGGKGVIDIMLLYWAGDLEAVRAMLDQRGFQKQTGRDPFPEERPMRTGAIEWNGKRFRIHAHVIAAESAEAGQLREFRDQLRGDSALRAAYVNSKRAILGAGITDTLDYCVAKGEFIERTLARLG